MNITALIILVVLVVLGIVSVFFDILLRRKQQIIIRNYTSQVYSLSCKLDKNEDFSTEKNYIIAHTPEVSSLFRSPQCPELTLSKRLVNNGFYGIDIYFNEIAKEELQANQRLEDEKRCILKQLWNPFTLFYRGIGMILRYVFGYLIEIFNKDFDYDGTIWKIIEIVVSLVVGIFTIMTFFGYDFSKIISLLN